MQTGKFNKGKSQNNCQNNEGETYEEIRNAKQYHDKFQERVEISEIKQQANQAYTNIYPQNQNQVQIADKVNIKTQQAPSLNKKCCQNVTFNFKQYSFKKRILLPLILVLILATVISVPLAIILSDKDPQVDSNIDISMLDINIKNDIKIRQLVVGSSVQSLGDDFTVISTTLGKVEVTDHNYEITITQRQNNDNKQLFQINIPTLQTLISFSGNSFSNVDQYKFLKEYNQNPKKITSTFQNVIEEVLQKNLEIGSQKMIKITSIKKQSQVDLQFNMTTGQFTLANYTDFSSTSDLKQPMSQKTTQINDQGEDWLSKLLQKFSIFIKNLLGKNLKILIERAQKMKQYYKNFIKVEESNSEVIKTISRECTILQAVASSENPFRLRCHTNAVSVLVPQVNIQALKNLSDVVITSSTAIQFEITEKIAN